MALKKVTHRAKVAFAHEKETARLAFESDSAHVRLRCCEARYNDAVSKGDADKAVEEHRNRIFFTKEVRLAQNNLWDHVRNIMPEVPEPTPNTAHSIDLVSGCEVCWTTYEEVPPEASPQDAKRETVKA